jgi:preprotein translocase subunit YajC
MMTKVQEYTDKIAKRLVIGDKVVSSSGKILTVSLVVNKANKTIILFDGDMEIDVDPYFRFEKVLKTFK